MGTKSAINYYYIFPNYLALLQNSGRSPFVSLYKWCPSLGVPDAKLSFKGGMNRQPKLLIQLSQYTHSDLSRGARYL